ncbi:expressed unknown protein [Seminavis robusta]|uniref:Uncharacterized protein n=1 Tax=Seminavis robusta TaxID=568900 RepID=A0A9N8DSU2_9STRA|nr:expressed unknown protein [Seminavis robusta]|eukprot:Sro330_g118910.1 n/a (239) ;mRNA; f:30543-31259
MTISSTSSICLECNSRAIECLQEGDPCEATRLLKVALTRLQSDMTFIKFQNNAAAPQDDVASCFTYGSIYGISVSPDLLTASLFQSQDNLFPCYFRAFEVDENAQESLNTSTTFVIVLYNLALSMLLESQYKGRRISRHEIAVVLQMFQAALKAANVLWDNGHREEVLYLVLGITTNLGFLHSLCHNVKEARDHLLLAVDLVGHAAAEDVVPLEDYEFFYTSTCMFSSGVNLNIAPAA